MLTLHHLNRIAGERTTTMSPERQRMESKQLIYAEKILSSLSVKGVMWATLMTDLSSMLKQYGNGSGLLSYFEFGDALARLNVGLDPKEQDELIETLMREDGTIDYRDFKSLLVDCRNLRNTAAPTPPRQSSRRRRTFRSEAVTITKHMGGFDPATQRALSRHQALQEGRRELPTHTTITLQFDGDTSNAPSTKQGTSSAEIATTYRNECVLLFPAS